MKRLSDVELLEAYASERRPFVKSPPRRGARLTIAVFEDNCDNVIQPFRTDHLFVGGGSHHCRYRQ